MLWKKKYFGGKIIFFNKPCWFKCDVSRTFGWYFSLTSFEIVFFLARIKRVKWVNFLGKPEIFNVINCKIEYLQKFNNTDDHKSKDYLFNINVKYEPFRKMCWLFQNSEVKPRTKGRSGSTLTFSFLSEPFTEVPSFPGVENTSRPMDFVFHHSWAWKASCLLCTTQYVNLLLPVRLFFITIFLLTAFGLDFSLKSWGREWNVTERIKVLQSRPSTFFVILKISFE